MSHRQPGFIQSGWQPGLVAGSLLSLLLLSHPAGAAELNRGRTLLKTGRYEECIAEATRALGNRDDVEDWAVLKARAELTLGQYRTALKTIDAGLERTASSLRLRLLGHRAALQADQPERAREFLQQIERRGSRSRWRYTAPEDLVVRGRAALLLGADARTVLEDFFDRARQAEAEALAPSLASGRLALEKHDFQLAAEFFEQGLEHHPDHPDLHLGLARSYENSDSKRALRAWQRALEINPRHVPSLLWQVDRLIDSEQYDEASTFIDRILAVNPKHPKAWAYRAVLAHLRNDPQGETIFRTMALGPWSRNPEVVHLIGKKLSQKYRFAEGLQYQRQALDFDPDYTPARIQMARDLLRLGREEVGWKLAEMAHRANPYDVASFNLVELRDELEDFATLENEHFLLRMAPRETALYGREALDLLTRARQVLCEKYGLDLHRKTIVEIFPDENDFAVRTFGMPAVSGYLGVCFGNVITANSPASQAGHPTNWQSVLWHEFCHTVTLHLTNNRMPRWLSEGISVYEERRADPRWGQRMTPRYRKMILDGELTPIGELSGAFLSPESPVHVQFAYYQSSLVVEFLVDRYGLDSLRSILHDLGAGLPINVALERRTDPLPQLEADFERFAKRRAEALAPKADWSRPDLAEFRDAPAALERYVQEHPNNFFALTAYAQHLLERNRRQEAKKPLQRLLEISPGYTGGDNAYEMLARVHRELGETEQECDVLDRFAQRSDDALSAHLRLIELHQRAGDWKAVLEDAREALAINPLIAPPHRALARSAEELGDAEAAIRGYRALLHLEPEDPAEVHYRLARLLHEQDAPGAQRHVLIALEEAPRYRAAHQLLLEMVRNAGTADEESEARRAEPER